MTIFFLSKIGSGFGELGSHTPTKNSKESPPALFRLETQRQHVWQLLYKNSINIENQHADVFVIVQTELFYADALNPEEKVLGHFV